MIRATVAKSGTSFAAPLGSAMALLYIEAIHRQAVGIEQLTQNPVSQPYQANPQIVLDQYFPLVCLKPAGSPAAKDNDYGYGMPFGPLLYQAIQAGGSPSLDVASIVSEFMVPMVGVIAMGMIMKQTVPV